MAKAGRKMNGRVMAFRSEVSMLRNVIKRTVNEVIREELEDVETLKRKQRLIEADLKKAETKSSLFRDLRPLIKRVEALERAVRDVEKAASGKVVERSIRDVIKGRKVEGVLEDMVESRLSSFNNKVLMLRREIEMMRGELDSSRTRKLEEEFERRLGKLKSEIAEVAVEHQSKEEVFDSDIRGLKKAVKDMRPFGGQSGRIDVDELRRDLEIIKTKQEWIENNIERIDIKPLLRKIEELEHRIRVITVSSPIVLE